MRKIWSFYFCVYFTEAAEETRGRILENPVPATLSFCKVVLFGLSSKQVWFERTSMQTNLIGRVFSCLKDATAL